MKRKSLFLIAMLLTVSMVFTACGGGSKKDTSSGSETESEGQQAEDTEEEPESEEPESPEQESAEPEAENGVRTVEITMDNWQEYLEIVPKESMAFHLMTGAFPDPETVDFFEYELDLKEEYAKGYLEHADYTLPELNGTTLGIAAIRMVLDSGAMTVGDYADIRFSYTMDYPDSIRDFSPLPEERGAENMRGLNDAAFARYLIALEDGFGEYNDCLKFYGMPLMGIVIPKDADISSLAGSGNGTDVLAENVTIDIKSISGTIHVWE